MSKLEKILTKVLRGNTDNNIRFDELILLLTRLGFSYRIKGSHHIFYKEDIVEILNLQDASGFSKPYQVKQVRNLIVKYKLELHGDDNT